MEVGDPLVAGKLLVHVAKQHTDPPSRKQVTIYCLNKCVLLEIYPSQ